MSIEEKGDQRWCDEAVGYGRPPVATRYKKGESGNPNGRPKGALNVATAIFKAMREKVTIHENGKRRVVTKLEAATKQIVNKAASGNMQALRFLFDFLRQIEKSDDPMANSANLSSDIDQEVIQGLLDRFESQQSELKLNPEPEVELDDDQRS